VLLPIVEEAPLDALAGLREAALGGGRVVVYNIQETPRL
jgi:hypothetical protein